MTTCIKIDEYFLTWFENVAALWLHQRDLNTKCFAQRLKPLCSKYKLAAFPTEYPQDGHTQLGPKKNPQKTKQNAQNEAFANYLCFPLAELGGFKDFRCS